MAQTRVKLTTEGKQFAQAGYVRFRVGFTGVSGGVTRYYGQQSCPIITIGHGDPNLSDVLGTTDDWAAANLIKMYVPAKTRRGGTARDPGPMFEDVTATTDPGDVALDLDTIFDTVRGA